VDPALIAALDGDDIAGAIEWIRSEDDPARVLAMLHGAINHVYWARKNVPAVVQLGAAAVDFAGRSSDEGVLGLLKGIAYDVGSFCWIGWDEPGVVIDDNTRAAGHRAALLNLELAERLDRPSRPRSAAHWIVGAHELAAGRRDESVGCFEASARYAREGGDLGAELLALGYIAIAHGQQPDVSGFAGIEDGDEYAAQLRTASRVFGAP